jgi:undecaprenyl diphosphate synthase
MAGQFVKSINIPQHLAIIMDGNGRWAQQRGLPRSAGHIEGVQTALRITEACVDSGIRVLTLFAFSTENWSRPKMEVDFLMQIAEEYTNQELPNLLRNGVRLQHMGRRDGLPSSLLDTLDNAAVRTKGNSRLILNLALNYGGKIEIIDAMKAMISDHQNGKVKENEIDETLFSQYLYCPEIQNIDLVIRTSGEWRLSNFQIWRSADAYFWNTPVLWPDFERKHLKKAINDYAKQISRKSDVYETTINRIGS